MPPALRVAFAGTPEFAAEALEAIVGAGFAVPLVLTQPDRPAGRGLKLQRSAVAEVAARHGLSLQQPRSLKRDGRYPEDALQAGRTLEATALDLMVVAAYGLILPRWVLELPRLGCLNIHASLLPRWRGAAPIHRAVEAGDTRTGITLMQMDAGLDTGDMLIVEEEPISPDDTTARLHDRLAAIGASLTVQALQRLDRGEALPRQAQPAQGVTYAHKIAKAEAPLDWRQPADLLERRIRAFDPFPGAHLVWDGAMLKVWRARTVAGPDGVLAAEPGTVWRPDPARVAVACGAGWLELLEVQPAGARRMPAAAFLASSAGRQLADGAVLALPQPLAAAQVPVSAGR